MLIICHLGYAERIAIGKPYACITAETKAERGRRRRMAADGS